MTKTKKPRPFRRFRKRLEKSRKLAWVFGLIARSYLSFCNQTTRWEHEGREALQNDLRNGPVLMIMWHSRCMMAGHHWPKHAGNLSTLHTSSPIARVIGAVHRHLRLLPAEMSDKTANRASSRMVLSRVKEGVSIGMTVDGPLGPARVVKDAPLDWARTTGMPVYAYAFATSRGRHLQTWDRMFWPRPFGKGACVYHRLDTDVPRKVTPDAREKIRADFARALDTATARADICVAREPGP